MRTTALTRSHCRPDLLEVQAELVRRFLPSWEYVVVADGRDADTHERICAVARAAGAVLIEDRRGGGRSKKQSGAAWTRHLIEEAGGWVLWMEDDCWPTPAIQTGSAWHRKLEGDCGFLPTAFCGPAREWMLAPMAPVYRDGFGELFAGVRHTDKGSVMLTPKQARAEHERLDYLADELYVRRRDWCPMVRHPVTGLGDAIARVTMAVGIKPCGGCKQRQAALNRLVPFGGSSDG